jgi:hypothetical protein
VARSWPAYILPVALIGGGIAFLLRKDTVPSTPSSANAAPRIPLLDGLGVGDVIGAFRVSKIFVSRSHTDQPQLSIELERENAGFTVWVARKPLVKNPPMSTDRYALTYGDARPVGVVIVQPTYDAAMTAIAERIRRTEATAPVPEGL